MLNNKKDCKNSKMALIKQVTHSIICFLQSVKNSTIQNYFVINMIIFEILFCSVLYMTNIGICNKETVHVLFMVLSGINI